MTETEGLFDINKLYEAKYQGSNDNPKKNVRFNDTPEILRGPAHGSDFATDFNTIAPSDAYLDSANILETDNVDIDTDPKYSFEQTGEISQARLKEMAAYNAKIEKRKQIENLAEQLEMSKHTRDKQKKILKLQDKIYTNSNPNPYIITMCVISVILILWVSYRLFLRRSVSGNWYDDGGNYTSIYQNMITDNLSIFYNDSHVNGKVSGNAIIISDMVGIWDGNDKIIINGNSLKRAV